MGVKHYPYQFDYSSERSSKTSDLITINYDSVEFCPFCLRNQHLGRILHHMRSCNERLNKISRWNGFQINFEILLFILGITTSINPKYNNYYKFLVPQQKYALEILYTNSLIIYAQRTKLEISICPK